MTDENIERLIDALNAHEMSDRIYLATLSQKVEYAKVWINDPNGSPGDETPYTFYFIKNDAGIYVAAVLDMVNDVHFFVKNEHRGKGDLEKAMVDVVFPKLFQDGRTIQNATFRNSRVGAYCVRKFGFTMTGDLTAEKDLSVFSNAPAIFVIRKNININEFEEIKSNINKEKSYLYRVKEKLELAYGGCEDTFVNDMISDLYDLDDNVLDYIESQQGRLE